MNKGDHGSIAIARMQRLAELAEEKCVNGNKSLEHRYVKLLIQIAEHSRVKIPKEIKHRICRKCSNLLVPGIDCKKRMVASKGVVFCICECGNQIRIHFNAASAHSKMR